MQQKRQLYIATSGALIMLMNKSHKHARLYEQVDNIRLQQWIYDKLAQIRELSKSN